MLKITLAAPFCEVCKYIEAPKPELYDLASDPNELKNLFESERTRAKALSERISAIRAGAPAGHAGRAPAPETVAALRSLGYLSGSTASSRVAAKVDPKDRIGDFERYYTALALASGGKLVESNGLLEKLRDRLPDVVDIPVSLGLNLERLGKFAQAAGEFKRALDQGPANAQARFELGFCYFRLGQPDSGIAELQAALALEPWYTRADELLAGIYIQQKNFAQARSHLNHLLSIDPRTIRRITTWASSPHST